LREVKHDAFTSAQSRKQRIHVSKTRVWKTWNLWPRDWRTVQSPAAKSREGIWRRQRRLDSSHRGRKRRVQSHRASGHRETQSPNISVLRSIEQTAKTSAPTQLTLDTPRVSAGAASAAFSEKHRALPDCDVNDSWASAAPGSVAARMLISPVFIRARNIVANQGALFATRGSKYFGNGGRKSSRANIRVHR